MGTGRGAGQGSRTCSAEKVFLPDVQVQVLNTQPAIPEMHLLLVAVAVTGIA